MSGIVQDALHMGIASLNKSASIEYNRIYKVKFDIDNNIETYYNAQINFSGISFQDRYSNFTSDIQSNMFINLMDVPKMIRDYPTLSNTQIYNIQQQLQWIGMQIFKSGVTDLTNYVLHVSLSNQLLNPLTTPALPSV